MPVKIPIDHFRHLVSIYPIEFEQEFRAVGTDDGGNLTLSDDDADKLNKKWFSHHHSVTGKDPMEGVKMRGAGDVVAVVAQPIAGVIDAVFGTSLKGCGGCTQRQEDWNKAIPFK